jgi:2-polyprenyl-3-methyl-5-hydroxy-6-metoxy-1,4-benzoquinol methylase
MTPRTTAAFDETKRDAFGERMFGAALGFADILTIYLGDRLGLYDALRDGSPHTAAELASRAGADERYMREWLEQQAAAGILDVDDVAAAPAARRYSLAPEHAEVLTHRDSVSYLAPFVRMMAGATATLPQLLDAFRSGNGISYAAYGADVIEGQADINRATFLTTLGTEWLPSVPDVHARLSAAGARVADVGCGAAWSSIAIAQAYPHATVDGFDLDEASIAMAKRHASDAGLTDRVRPDLRDAADPALRGVYDLVVAFECVHDMSQPVAVLRAMREMAADDGAVIIMDERTEEAFAAPAGDLDRLFYAWSVLLCLPAGLADTPSAGTGTVMRPAHLDAYAREAGFARTEVLPIEHPAFRFYRLWK